MTDSSALLAIIADQAAREGALGLQVKKLRTELTLAHEEVEKAQTEATAAQEKTARENFAGSYHLDGIERLLREREDLKRGQTDSAELRETLVDVLETWESLEERVAEKLDRLQDDFSKYLAASGLGYNPIGSVTPAELEEFRKMLDNTQDEINCLTDKKSDWPELEELKKCKQE